MLKSYVKTCEAVKRLGTDQGGVVSFEYVIVAACIVAAVVIGFGPGTQMSLTTALINGITSVCTAFLAAVG